MTLDSDMPISEILTAWASWTSSASVLKSGKHVLDRSVNVPKKNIVVSFWIDDDDGFRVEKAMSKLRDESNSRYLCVSYRYLNRLSLRDIAGKLKCSFSTVKRNIDRGEAFLHECIFGLNSAVSSVAVKQDTYVSDEVLKRRIINELEHQRVPIRTTSSFKGRFVIGDDALRVLLIEVLERQLAVSK